MNDHSSKLAARFASDPQQTVTSAGALVADFVARWRCGERPVIESFLPDTANLNDDVLKSLVKADMAERARHSETIRIEDYLARFPSLATNEASLRELLVEEFCLRRQHGDSASLDEYAQRFPAQIATLRAELGGAASQKESSEPDTKAPASSSPVPQAPQTVSAPGWLPFDMVDVMLASGESLNMAGSGASGDRSAEIPRFGAPAASRSQLEFDPGAAIGDFEIVRLLGEGAAARVYLAKQRPLDRLVALKVSANTGDEGRTLASLEHDHIVQVFAEQVVHNRRLMAMRYLPSITLARLLDLLADADRGRLTGRDLFARVDREIGQSPAAQEAAARNELDRLNFVQVCCHMMLGLARALEHAHRQHVLHRDVKPANVLIAQSGRALLMDFNIASRRPPARAIASAVQAVESGNDHALPDRPGRSGIARAAASVFGGTPAYMAPEHISAMLLQSRQEFERVDERSDIFSLGIVFSELLSGRHPFRMIEASAPFAAALNQMLADRLRGAPPLPRSGVAVTPGVESILAKCLAPLPAERYQQAADLAEDLERFLHDQPLRYATDPSWRERAGKWWRRNPGVRVAAVAVAGVLALVLGITVWSDASRLDRAEALLARVRSRLERDDSRQALGMLDEAHQALAAPVGVLRYFGGESRRARARVQMNELASMVAELELRLFQRLAASARAGVVLDGRPNSVDDAPTMLDPLAVFDVLASDDWRVRPAFLALDAEQRTEVEEDVTELLVSRAQAALLVPRQDASTQSVRDAVLELLRRVPPRFQETPAIAQLQRDARRFPAARDTAPAAPPAEWDEFDVYFMGVREANEGRFDAAIHYFTAARERCDDSAHALRYWAHFQHGDCATRARRPREAIVQYGACIGLRPELAWAYHNLGLIHAADRDFTLALEQFDQAIRCDARIASAHSNRGAMLKELGRYEEAIAACTEAIRLGMRAPHPYCNRGSALIHLGNRDAAIKDFKKALEIDPASPEARHNLSLLGIQPSR